MNSLRKTTTLILGVTIAIVIIFSYKSAVANLEANKSVEHLGDIPIGKFGAPTHLMKIR